MHCRRKGVGKHCFETWACSSFSISSGRWDRRQRFFGQADRSKLIFSQSIETPLKPTYVYESKIDMPQSPFPGAVPAAFPANEEERIQKLLDYRVLDTSPETAYDDIAKLAAYICGTPTSLVSLVDVSRQWFKSSIGLDATETPRDLAFCAHAILKPQVLVVPDACADERFENNPLVTGAPYIRFYAGAPLITSEGYGIGTLCVIDYVPKQLTTEQIQALEALARQVVGQLEMRLSVQRIETEMAQKEAAEIALRKINLSLKERTETIHQKNQQLEQALQQLRLAQSKLVQNEKMASLGQMVAGIAHEINNPASFIAGNIGPAKQYASDLLALVELYQKECVAPSASIQALTREVDLEFLSADFPQLLDSLKAGSQRIANIVKALRIFSRLDEADRKPADLQSGLESALMILRHRLQAQSNRPEIEVVKHVAPLPPILCCAGLLNQVFLNLLENAIDALENCYTQQSERPAQSQDNQQNLALGWTPKITITVGLNDREEVSITIADNGSGIHPAIKDRLFDPFFTTKPVGQGTGLGLATSRTIVVEQHQGRLECLSELDKDTQFTITFPLAKAVSVSTEENSPA